MNVAGLIFSNIHDQSIPELTLRRTMASIPFGCRYRLIDFALSNMVNSGITTVGVITHFNYQSLLDHIGTGKDWDMARRSGGIKILPPYITAYENAAAGKLYTTRLEAMMGAQNFIDRCGADYLVLADCDVIMNIDLDAVVEEHIKSEAFLTIVTKRVDAGKTPFDKEVDVMEIDKDGRITGISKETPTKGEPEVSTNLMIIRRIDLQEIISQSLSRGYHSFSHDVLPNLLSQKKVHAYRFDGWYACIGTLQSYFSTSMSLLESEAREDLFGNEERQIHTKIRNSAPSKYTKNAKVTNSLVADGCVVEGTVENSILFRGVKIGRGTVVKNCILLQDTEVGESVQLNCVIADKNAVIKDGRILSGHETMPFFIGTRKII